MLYSFMHLDNLLIQSLSSEGVFDLIDAGYEERKSQSKGVYCLSRRYTLNSLKLQYNAIYSEIAGEKK